MKIVLLMTSFALLALTGCGGGSSNNNNNSTPAPQDQHTVNITDTSSCQSTTPANQTLVGSWTASSATDDRSVRFDFTLSFDGTMLTVTNVCTAFGQAITAQVQVPYQASGSSLAILGTGDKTVEGAGLKCSVSVQPASTTYNLVGNCLALTNSGQTTELVRSGD